MFSICIYGWESSTPITILTGGHLRKGSRWRALDYGPWWAGSYSNDTEYRGNSSKENDRGLQGNVSRLYAQVSQSRAVLAHIHSCTPRLCHLNITLLIFSSKLSLSFWRISALSVLGRNATHNPLLPHDGLDKPRPPDTKGPPQPHHGRQELEADAGTREPGARARQVRCGTGARGRLGKGGLDWRRHKVHTNTYVYVCVCLCAFVCMCKYYR